MTTHEAYIDYKRGIALEKLMYSFHSIRETHKKCIAKRHHVIFFDGKLWIIHDEILDSTNEIPLLTTMEIYGKNISDSQCELLKSSLKILLKESL